MRSYPLSFVLGGYYHWRDRKIFLQGSFGEWWSPSIVLYANSFYLELRSNSVELNRNDSKFHGFEVRLRALMHLLRFGLIRCRMYYQVFLTGTGVSYIARMLSVVGGL